MSITMRKTHPAFNMTKEVMCLLPSLPHGSELDMMAEDLGISRESVNVHLKRIGEKYRLTMRPGSGDMAVGVGGLGWASLKEEADNYYTTVYGDNDNGI